MAPASSPLSFASTLRTLRLQLAFYETLDALVCPFCREPFLHGRLLECYHAFFNQSFLEEKVRWRELALVSRPASRTGENEEKYQMLASWITRLAELHDQVKDQFWTTPCYGEYAYLYADSAYADPQPFAGTASELESLAPACAGTVFIQRIMWNVHFRQGCVCA